MNFSTKKLPGTVRVYLSDYKGIPDGHYWIPEHAVQAIIKLQNEKSDIDAGGVFFERSEVPPVNDENRGLITTDSGLIVPEEHSDNDNK